MRVVWGWFSWVRQKNPLALDFGDDRLIHYDPIPETLTAKAPAFVDGAGNVDVSFFGGPGLFSGVNSMISLLVLGMVPITNHKFIHFIHSVLTFTFLTAHEMDSLQTCGQEYTKNRTSKWDDIWVFTHSYDYIKP